jgi:muramoyltetrapeptide carboxypeptidase
MRFVGISDFTAFQNAVLAKTGAITWAGPALCEGFGVGGQGHDAESSGVLEPVVPDEIMQACFDDLLLGQGEGTGWRQNPERTTDAMQSVSATPMNQRVRAEFFINNSVLWGGNLAVLTSLLGTPYFPDIKGGTLFLEDVAEHPYRIERMLTQLLHAGVLARQKAIVMGQFTDYQLIAHDRGFKLQTVVDRLRSQVKTPVLTNLPYGHVQTKVLLPVGAKVDLSAEGRDAMLLWGHV